MSLSQCGSFDLDLDYIQNYNLDKARGSSIYPPAPQGDGAPDDQVELVREVAHMLAEWEQSGESHTEFAERLVAYVRLKLSATSSAKRST
jgi:hypothetical protein